ncbi:MAG TPA: TonB-dependent receptor plug domain-containing protein [Polyangiaceae bacterium]|nr:TonB-dependent receptor plug domain-containing protein [Polyangiaceae bacterium]
MRSLLLASLLLASAFRPQRALAQTAAPAVAADVIVPPQLEGEPNVPYPDGAHGDVTIVMTVTVNADGSVRDAKASEFWEPFATAAMDAARRFHFKPATRGGRPVAAVIRFEIGFKEPRPQPVEPAPAGSAPGDVASGGAASAHEPGPHETKPLAPPLEPKTVEIEVRGARLAPAVSSLSRAEVRQLPGAFGDPFRAIEALPGVTPIISGLPFFYVRGAPPGNVGYFLDGVRVPYLYHVGLGPSIVHPAMVSRVDLYPGGYPARFGRYAGGIVSGETTLPDPQLHGEGNIRIFDAGAMAEGGFAGNRGTLLLGGRYSYTAAIVSLLAPHTRLDYRDYQLRASYDVTPKDRVTLFGFGSYDLVGDTTNDILTVLFGTEFYRADLRYDHDFDGGATFKSAVTLGFDQSRIGEQRNSQDRMLQVRAQLDRPIGKSALWRSGVDVVLDGYTADKKTYADPEDPDTNRFNDLFPPRTDTAAGIWTDVVWQAAERVEVTPGLRADVYGSGGETAYALDPRISARFKITDKLRIVHAYGIAHQPPAFVVPIPGLTPGKLRGGLQSSWQTSAGVELDLPGKTSLTTTVFHNAFFNMSDVLGVGQSNREDNLDPRADGSSVGFELYLHRNLSQKLGGYLSYTLSRTTRTIGGYTFPSAFDRTHVASGALAYDLGRRWRAGARLVFYTGVPKTVQAGGATLPAPSEHPERDPAFYRIDVRLEKRWQIGPKTWVSLVLEMLNATLHKETFGNREIGPVSIPSIGVEAGF